MESLLQIIEKTFKQKQMIYNLASYQQNTEDDEYKDYLANITIEERVINFKLVRDIWKTKEMVAFSTKVLNRFFTINVRLLRFSICNDQILYIERTTLVSFGLAQEPHFVFFFHYTIHLQNCYIRISSY